MWNRLTFDFGPGPKALRPHYNVKTGLKIVFVITQAQVNLKYDKTNTAGIMQSYIYNRLACLLGQLGSNLMPLP